jgi:hypothetical protein
VILVFEGSISSYCTLNRAITSGKSSSFFINLLSIQIGQERNVVEHYSINKIVSDFALAMESLLMHHRVSVPPKRRGLEVTPDQLEISLLIFSNIIYITSSSYCPSTLNFSSIPSHLTEESVVTLQILIREYIM